MNLAHLCSPRLHLTLYEPMKWLNHFTTDVYNAIDPYLFITPGPLSLLHVPCFLTSEGRKVTFLLLLGLYPGETNLICAVGDVASREASFPRALDIGNFIALELYVSWNCIPVGFRFYRRSNDAMNGITTCQRWYAHDYIHRLRIFR